MQRIQMSSVRASLAVFVGVAAFGTAQADFPIRVTADSDRDAVTVYNDSTGEYLAAGYQDGGSPLFDKPIFVQRLSADGTPIGGAKKVWDFGAYPFDLAYNPSRADFMLAVSYHFFIGSEAIYVVNIDDVGDLDSQTPVMQGVLDPGPNFDAGRPGAQPINIAYNSIAQEYLVTAQLTWESGGTDFYAIRSQRVAGDGTPIGSEVDVWGPFPSTSPQSHALAYAPVTSPQTPTGRYLLAVGGSSLYMLNSDGAMVEVFSTPNDEPDGGDWIVGGGQSNPDVAYGEVDGQPSFLVVYEDHNNDSPFVPGVGQAGIWGVQVDADTLDHLAFGAMFGPFPISSICSHTLEPWTPSVQFDDFRDEFAVVWRETGRIGSGCTTDTPVNHVRSQRVGADFVSLPLVNPFGRNAVVSSATGTAPGNEQPLHPDVAVGPNGAALVVWDDAREAPVNDRDMYGAIWAGLPNDQFVEALPIGVGTHTGTLFGATNDGASDCGNAGASPDVWYLFTAPDDGELRVSTCGTNDLPGIDLGVDTVLSLHAAGSPDANIAGQCNDDWPGSADPVACSGQDDGLSRDSALVYAMTAGEHVWIRVTSFSGATTGDFLLHVEFGGAIPGDIDGDGDVDIADLGELLASYDTCDGDPDWNPAVDINGDGCIDIADLGELLANFGVGT
jgi:hypothetical protein